MFLLPPASSLAPVLWDKEAPSLKKEAPPSLKNEAPLSLKNVEKKVKNDFYKNVIDCNK